MFKSKFKNRTITETLTAGDCLKRRRIESGLSTKEIGEKLGIRVDYLDGLEGGDYKNLPPQVYVRGFIRSYSNFLGLDADQVIKIYNREISFRESGIGKNKKGKDVDIARKMNLGRFFVVTPKILTFAMGFVVMLAFGYYAFHQINSFNSKPYLFIESPTGDTVVSEKNITVVGKTEKDVILEINGQEVSVGADGYFRQDLVLSSGRNLLVVEAKNRFGKTETKEINAIYEKIEENTPMIEETKEIEISDDDPSPIVIIEEEIVSSSVADTDIAKNISSDEETVSEITQ
ncbi:MAG: helix-turn-helix domain-containing protein [Candidatus Pacebacteria bacterium]|nr:helix-turn-helix domain-containing protein [Candidatus Paceibacterota bacterium]